VDLSAGACDTGNHEAGSGSTHPSEAMNMRVYTQPHRFYCGVDLHARTLFLHVLDHDGQTHFEKNIPARPDHFLDAVKPFRDGLVVGVKCMFAWYWLADLCASALATPAPGSANC
jgi:hypothetical protein